MQEINQVLLQRIQSKLCIKQRKAYSLIEEKVAQTHLERRLAAILVAQDAGIAISKYVTPEDLAIIRGTGGTKALPEGVPPSQPATRYVRIPEPISVDLVVLHSSELKAILKRDLAELNAARSRGVKKTAKTCMVLCGSIVEAILLDAIKHRKTKALAAAAVVSASLLKKLSSNPEEWGLFEMVSVAMAMQPPLLPQDVEPGAIQLSRWRNLIHPGRELREKKNKRIQPSATRAEAAIAFLQLLSKELRH